MNWIEVQHYGSPVLINLDGVDMIAEGPNDSTHLFWRGRPGDEYDKISEPYDDFVARILEMQKRRKE